MSLGIKSGDGRRVQNVTRTIGKLARRGVARIERTSVAGDARRCSTGFVAQRQVVYDLHHMRTTRHLPQCSGDNKQVILTGAQIKATLAPSSAEWEVLLTCTDRRVVMLGVPPSYSPPPVEKFLAERAPGEALALRLTFSSRSTKRELLSSVIGAADSLSQSPELVSSPLRVTTTTTS